MNVIRIVFVVAGCLLLTGVALLLASVFGAQPQLRGWGFVIVGVGAVVSLLPTAAVVVVRIRERSR